jgi:hypothetical protein
MGANAAAGLVARVALVVALDVAAVGLGVAAEGLGPVVADLAGGRELMLSASSL